MGSKSDRPDPEYTALVRRALPDLEALFQAGDDALALLSSPGWAHVTRLLDALVTEIEVRLDGQRLGEKPLPTQAEYALAHGRRSGLRAPSELARAIVAESERRRREQAHKHEDASEYASQGA